VVLVTLSWQKFSKSAFYKISNTTMISETFSSMLLNPVHIHQSFNHPALQMRGKMIHNQNKEMFLQPGYLMIDKVNNVFRKLHGTGFSYKIQLDQMFQPLSSLRWQKCFTCLHTGDLSPADSTSEKLTFPTHNQKEPEGHNSKYPLSKGYGLCVCVCVHLFGVGWGRTLWIYPHSLQQRLGETDLY